MRSQSAARLVAGLTLLLGAVGAVGQGSFQNLDFEQARIVPIPGNPNFVATTTALPGWTAFIGGTAVDLVLYDDISLGSPAISIHDTNGFVTVLEGNYTISLQPSFDRLTIPAIAQLGLVPSTARSLRFYGTGLISVSFEGQEIPLSVLGTTSTYNIYGGDISAFAGQSGSLQFRGGGSLDNIVFSNLPVPEPGIFGIFALGALLLGWPILRRR